MANTVNTEKETKLILLPPQNVLPSQGLLYLLFSLWGILMPQISIALLPISVQMSPFKRSLLRSPYTLLMSLPPVSLFTPSLFLFVCLFETSSSMTYFVYSLSLPLEYKVHESRGFVLSIVLSLMPRTGPGLW